MARHEGEEETVQTDEQEDVLAPESAVASTKQHQEEGGVGDEHEESIYLVGSLPEGSDAVLDVVVDACQKGKPGDQSAPISLNIDERECQWNTDVIISEVPRHESP